MNKTILLLLLLGLSPRAWAFPEMVRHDYPNCATCHVSPTGGGVLTEYGREQSRLLLSTNWAIDREKESKFAYGLVTPPSWLDAMGIYRSVYVYRNTPYLQDGRYIFMQADLEAAAHIGKWIADATFGYQNPVGDQDFYHHLISRRHWLNYRPNDTISVRAGRFYPQYGILTPDHRIPTRMDLGWDENHESYNVEAAYIGETYNVFLTGIFGRPDEPDLDRELGFAIAPNMSIADHYKVGANFLYGDNDSRTRNLYGVWGILGFSRSFFLLTEWDVQRARAPSATDSTWGGVNYQRLDYELIQGLHVYGTQQLSRLDFSNKATLADAYGLGVQFFPRPHFELNLQWQKLRMAGASNDFSDYAYLMFNFYL